MAIMLNVNAIYRVPFRVSPWVGTAILLRPLDPMYRVRSASLLSHVECVCEF